MKKRERERAKERKREGEGIDLFGGRRVILTELEHASKHSNGAACVVRVPGGCRIAGEGRRRSWSTTERRVRDEIGRPIGRAGGRSAPGKRIRCNRPELSSRASLGRARRGEVDSGYRRRFPRLRIPTLRGIRAHPVAKD